MRAASSNVSCRAAAAETGVGAVEMEGQVVGCGKRGYEGGFFLGSLADAVVDVDHGEYDAQLVPLLEEAAE